MCVCVFGFGRHFGPLKKEKTFLIHMTEITGANADKLKGGMYSYYKLSKNASVVLV